MKWYKYLNTILLILFIAGTILSYQHLPSAITLYMQSPRRTVFIGVSFFILFVLACAAIHPEKISRNNNAVRNETTLVVLNLLGLSVFLFYFVTIAPYIGFQLDSLKLIVIIIGCLLIVVGNFLPQMPFRSRIGFKLPWILKDKRCWQKTHRFAGYTAIPFGILQCLLVFFVSNTNLIFLFGVGLWLLIVCLYSLTVLKKQ